MKKDLHKQNLKRKNKCEAHAALGKSWDRLPNKVKNYINELEQRSDPSGDVQTIACLAEQRDALVAALQKGSKHYRELYDWAERADKDLALARTVIVNGAADNDALAAEIYRLRLILARTVGIV